MPHTKAKTNDVDDCYRLLAAAVVEAAVRDYEAGYRLRNVEGLDSYNYISAREFLLSDRLKLFTNIDGKAIIKHINHLVDSGSSLKEQAKKSAVYFAKFDWLRKKKLDDYFGEDEEDTEITGA